MGSHKRCSCRHGSVLVEAALVITVLCMVLIGAIKYGWLFYQMHYVTSASREGARLAVKEGTTEGDVADAVLGVMQQVGSPAYTLTITPPLTDAPPGVPVEVKISLSTAQPGVDIAPGFLPSPPELVGKTTMAKEGSTDPGR